MLGHNILQYLVYILPNAVFTMPFFFIPFHISQMPFSLVRAFRAAASGPHRSKHIVDDESCQKQSLQKTTMQLWLQGHFWNVCVWVRDSSSLSFDHLTCHFCPLFPKHMLLSNQQVNRCYRCFQNKSWTNGLHFTASDFTLLRASPHIHMACKVLVHILPVHSATFFFLIFFWS